ncbi:hypothetical protein [Sporosarcina sp. FSL K6-3457]|uniref:hypothetical protein n=1 Tax=Sporosarcina sp. FSL K6-3457 TaxID=2978204 RepID=UPI0030F4E21F
MERVIKVRVPTKMQVRFNLALNANKEVEEEVLCMLIAGYVEKHEEDVAAKKLNEEANLLKTKNATPSN